MSLELNQQLSRRERQIMDAVIRLGEASVVEIMESIPDAPSNAALRRLISILEQKGFVTHRKEGKSYIYRSARDVSQIRSSAIDHLRETVFRGSAFKAMAAMLDISSKDLTQSELDELAAMIAKAKGEEQ